MLLTLIQKETGTKEATLALTLIAKRHLGRKKDSHPN